MEGPILTFEISSEQLVTINGLPFVLPVGSKIKGNLANLGLAFEGKTETVIVSGLVKFITK